MIRNTQCRAWICALAGAAALAGAVPARAQAPDSLVLRQPTGLTVRSQFFPAERRFTVYLTWRDVADSLATFVHPPDTTGWRVTSPPDSIAVPMSRGPYTGDIDRTVSFRALDRGVVGQAAPLRVTYVIRNEDNLTGVLDFGSNYVPGTWLPLIFDDQFTPQKEQIDFGVQVAMSAGNIDRQGGFLLAMEDFEGYHIWRGTKPDGSDLEIIGEVSKQEAFIGGRPGGSRNDSLYFFSVLPALRDSIPWFAPGAPLEGMECLGTRIDLPLRDDELFWADCNAFNGFTYYYAVTTFDRGYEAGAGRQGLNKVDNCQVTEGMPYPCASEMRSVTLEVAPQNVMRRIYAVPNPYRTGGSRLTTQNYHNFPDGLIRFVNVPADAQLRVFTVAGDLVWETTNDATGNVEWNVRNLSNEEVASGVYIYRVVAPNGASMYGRLVIIR